MLTDMHTFRLGRSPLFWLGLFMSAVICVAWWDSYSFVTTVSVITTSYETSSLSAKKGGIDWTLTRETGHLLPRLSLISSYNSRTEIGSLGWDTSLMPGFSLERGEENELIFPDPVTGSYTRLHVTKTAGTVPYWAILSPVLAIWLTLLYGRVRRQKAWLAMSAADDAGKVSENT